MTFSNRDKGSWSHRGLGENALLMSCLKFAQSGIEGKFQYWYKGKSKPVRFAWGIRCHVDVDYINQ